jgi:hypothetical protein
MFAIIVSLFVFLLMLVVGAYSEAFRRIVDVILRGFYFVARLFGIKVCMQEKTRVADIRVRKQFKGVRRVSRSRENAKPITSISYFGLVLLMFGLLCFIVNMEMVSGGIIAEWLTNLGIENQQANTVVAVVSSVSMTFGLSMLWSQWKLATSYRQEARKKKVKRFAKAKLTEQEMLDIVEEKVKEKE